MTRARLYMDECSMEQAVIDALRRAGTDVRTAREAEMRGRTDEAQLEFAIAQQRAMHSFNVAHFARLHRDYLASGRQHWGIVVIPRQRYSTRQLIRRLLALLDTTDADDLRNEIVYL